MGAAGVRALVVLGVKVGIEQHFLVPDGCQHLLIQEVQPAHRHPRDVGQFQCHHQARLLALDNAHPWPLLAQMQPIEASRVVAIHQHRRPRLVAMAIPQILHALAVDEVKVLIDLPVDDGQRHTRCDKGIEAHAVLAQHTHHVQLFVEPEQQVGQVVLPQDVTALMLGAHEVVIVDERGFLLGGLASARLGQERPALPQLRRVQADAMPLNRPPDVGAQLVVGIAGAQGAVIAPLAVAPVIVWPHGGDGVKHLAPVLAHGVGNVSGAQPPLQQVRSNVDAAAVQHFGQSRQVNWVNPLRWSWHHLRRSLWSRAWDGRPGGASNTCLRACVAAAPCPPPGGCAAEPCRATPR